MQTELIILSAFLLAVIIVYAIRSKVNLSDAFVSIIHDTLNGKFTFRRWHLHALGFFVGGIASYLMNLDFNGLESVFEFLLPFGAVCIISALVEWVQGKLFGANKTAAEAFESKKDMLVTDFFGMLGVITAMIVL
jgi:hypothetical protein